MTGTVEFIGLPGFQEEAPFDVSTPVLFHKRISAEMLMEAKEYLLDHKDDNKDAPAPKSGEKNSDDDTAKGRYCKRARKEYLAFAKSKKHT